MKKTVRLLLGCFLFTCICLPMDVQAQELYSEGYFQYIIRDSGIEIRNYFGREERVEIPDHIAEMPVVSIADRVFRSDLIREIIIPETVEQLSADAFLDAINLQNIVNHSKAIENQIIVEDSVTIIKEYPRYLDSAALAAIKGEGSSSTGQTENVEKEGSPSDDPSTEILAEKLDVSDEPSIISAKEIEKTGDSLPGQNLSQQPESAASALETEPMPSVRQQKENRMPDDREQAEESPTEALITSSVVKGPAAGQEHSGMEALIWSAIALVCLSVLFIGVTQMKTGGRKSWKHLSEQENK